MGIFWSSTKKETLRNEISHLNRAEKIAREKLGIHKDRKRTIGELIKLFKKLPRIFELNEQRAYFSREVDKISEKLAFLEGQEPMNIEKVDVRNIIGRWAELKHGFEMARMGYSRLSENQLKKLKKCEDGINSLFESVMESFEKEKRLNIAEAAQIEKARKAMAAEKGVPVGRKVA